MPSSGPRRQNLVILAACGGAALVFLGGGLLYIWSKTSRMDRLNQMLAAAPQTLAAGATSNLFLPDAPGRPADDDITGFHPAYLMGAMSQMFNGNPDCSAATVKFIAFQAYCRWPGGSLNIESNTMPELLTHKPPNAFNQSGMPVDSAGEVVTISNWSAMDNNITVIFYSDIALRVSAASNNITRVLTGHKITDIAPNGSWFAANEKLGFKTCFIFKMSTSFSAYCYQKT